MAAPRLAALDALLGSIHDSRESTNCLQIIDADLCSLDLLTSSIRTRHNAYIPVSRLPSEILAQIFLFLSFGAGSKLVRETSPGHMVQHKARDLGWIKVTHVCRHWRQVALAHLSLWTTITNDLGAKWVPLMLARAQSLPVNIQWNPLAETLGKASPVEVDFAPHLSHIRTLQISDTIDRLSQIIHTLLQPAPMLERITILDTALGSSILHVPADLFASNAPRLRTARFIGLIVSLDVPILQHITTLDIRLRSPSPECLPSTDQFFNSLSKLHCLESLRIEHYLPRCPDGISVRSQTRHPPIMLPQLSKIMLEGPLRSCAVAISSIYVPPTVSIGLIPHAEGLADDLRAFIPVLETVSGKLGGVEPIRMLQVTDNRDNGVFSVFAWRFLCDIPDDKPLSNFPKRPTISINYRAPKEDRPDALNKLYPVYRSLCLPVVWMLGLTFYQDVKTDWFEPPLLSCPNLQRIFMWGPRLKTHLCDALGPVSNSGSQGDAKVGVHFPSLRSIHLSSVEIDNMTHERIQFRKRFKSVLEMRRELSVPLKRLDLKNCSASTRHLNQLNQLVPEVFCSDDGL